MADKNCHFFNLFILMETKIASYQEPGIRLQLIKIIDETYTDHPIITYQIRKNRKVISTWDHFGLDKARQKFMYLIQNELLQVSIVFEEYNKEL